MFSLLISGLFLIGSENVSASEVSEKSVEEKIIKRSQILDLLLEIDFESKLTDKEIKDINKIKLKFKDISVINMKENEVFNLKYLIHKGAVANSDKFNGYQNLKMSHYVKIMSKSFGIEFNKNNFSDVNFLNKDNSLVIPNNNLITSELISKLIYSDILKSYFLTEDGNIDVSYYNLINRFISITDNNKLEKKVTVGNETQLYEALKDMEQNTYYQYTITSTYSNGKELQNTYNEIIYKNEARYYTNFHTLYNYKTVNVKNRLIFTDNKRKYNSDTYKKSLEIFVSIFNDTGNKDKTFKEIYDYVYNSITYNANGFNYMLITNLGNGEMACNGISRLVNELLISNGYESEIIGGTSHFWNVVKIDGKDTFVDLTTDIITKNYGVTLGESNKNHNQIIVDGGINYYSAGFKIGQERIIYENLEAKNLLK